MPEPRIGMDRAAARRVGAVLMVGGVAYLLALLAAAGAPSLRAVLLRYALVVAGIFAVAPPHVLWPDQRLALLQLLNPSPQALLKRQLGRWAGVLVAFLLPPVALAVQAPGPAGRALVETALVVLSTGAYAFAHYAGLGPKSLVWQAGEGGRGYRRLLEIAPQLRLSVPWGLVPSVLATAWVFAVGAAVVLTTVALGPAVAWIPGTLLLVLAGLQLARCAGTYDRAFYSTNALYVELLRGGRAAEREPIQYEAVYWAPRRLRPHVWAALVQLDRRLPLGRLVALGVLVLWGLFLQNASGGLMAAYLLLVLLLKNAAVFKLAAEPLAPRAFDLWLQGPVGWLLTRFFASLRWTLPLALALAAVVLFHPTFGWADLGLWVGVDLGLALVTAAAATYAAEAAHRRRYA